MRQSEPALLTVGGHLNHRYSGSLELICRTLFLLCLFALHVAAASTVASAAAEKAIASFEVVRGTAQICKITPGSRHCRPARTGDNVVPGETVITGPDGVVEITYNPEFKNYFGLSVGQVVLYPSTEAELGEAVVWKKPLVGSYVPIANLISGALRGLVRAVAGDAIKPTVKFSVKASCALSSEFVVEQAEQGSGSVAVKKGNLACTLSDGGRRNVRQGHIMQTRDGRFQNLMPMTQDDWDRLIERVSSGKGTPIQGSKARFKYCGEPSVIYNTCAVSSCGTREQLETWLKANRPDMKITEEYPC